MERPRRGAPSHGQNPRFGAVTAVKKTKRGGGGGARRLIPSDVKFDVG